MSKWKSERFILICLVAILIVGALSYYIFKHSTKIQMRDISTWETYHNATYGFSFRYPSDYDLNVEEQGPPERPGLEPSGAVFIELNAPEKYQYGEHLELTIPYTNDRYAPLLEVQYWQEINQWVTLREQYPAAVYEEPICPEMLTLGFQKLPAYRFVRGDAGHSTEKTVLLLNDTLINFNIRSGPIGFADPHLPKILESFMLDDPSSVTTVNDCSFSS